MADASRRRFLAITGAGAVGVTAVALPRGASAAEPDTVPAQAQGSMAAYVHDVAKGEVALMVDGHEVVITDHRLVARIARAYHRAAPQT